MRGSRSRTRRCGEGLGGLLRACRASGLVEGTSSRSVASARRISRSPLLAILRCGAAYSPLDPAQPIERMRRMAGQARPAAVLTAPAYAPEVREAVANSCASQVIELGPKDGARSSSRPVTTGPSRRVRGAIRRTPRTWSSPPDRRACRRASSSRTAASSTGCSGCARTSTSGPTRSSCRRRRMASTFPSGSCSPLCSSVGAVHVADPDEHLDPRRLFADDPARGGDSRPLRSLAARHFS